MSKKILLKKCDMSQIDEIQRTLTDYISKDNDFKVKITEDIGTLKTKVSEIVVQTTYTNGSVKDLKAWRIEHDKQENVKNKLDDIKDTQAEVKTAYRDGKLYVIIMIFSILGSGIWAIASQIIANLFSNHLTK